MSTSIFYHGWGIKTYRVRRVLYERGVMIACLEKKAEKRHCAACGSLDTIVCGTKAERTWKTLPIGFRPVRLRFVPRILECKECGARLQERIDFATPRVSYCRRLGRFVIDLVRLLPISRVGRLLELHHETVKDLVKENLRRKAAKLPVFCIRRLAIDEIHISKKRDPKYLSIVLDLDTGHVVFVGEGRKEASIRPFFRRLRRARARIVAVAMDMWQPYRNVVEEFYPDAKIVFDPFHVVSNVNNAIDEVRRQEVARCNDEQGRKIIKGSRYLLLKSRKKLDEPAKIHLRALLAVNEALNKAYLLKEYLRLLWRRRKKSRARKHLNRWILLALASELKPMIKVAKMLQTHKNGVLAFFTTRITTGPLEGLNNALKLLLRKAYGYRDLAFLKLRLLFHHETKLMLSGV